MTEFAIGNQVRIKPEFAANYIQPWRRWAEQGRPGVITEIGASEQFKGQFRIDFAGKKKPKYPENYLNWFSINEIIPK